MDQGRSYRLNSGEKQIRFPLKKRIIIGASNSADICIAGLSDIHCLIEIGDDHCKVFSLAPSSQVKLNGKHVVASTIQIGDTLELGKSLFTFDEGLKKSLPKSVPTFKSAEDSSEIEKVDSGENGFDENYPLSADPSMLYSEYIFEDADIVFPIFKYHIDKKAVEVIILHKGKIFSVDYIPQGNGKYVLAGMAQGEREIELPYLGKDEKLPLLDIKGDEIYLNKIPGFKYTAFSDNKSKDSLIVQKDDIHIFEIEDIKIFVKGDEAPPMVKAAPILRRDKEFKKYLILCLLLVCCFITAVNLYEVDPEIERDKAPERIATILYKPKMLRVTKKKDPLTKKRKIKTKQKAEKKKIVKKSNSTKKYEISKGNLTAKGKSSARKARPKTGKPNKIKIVRGAKKKTGAAGKTSVKASAVKRKTSRSRNKGKVDTYKSIDFTSSLSNLMAKGGTLNSFKDRGGEAENFNRSSSILSSEDSATVRRAEMDSKVGTLTDATKGKLSSSFGTEGLVQKKKVFIAGVPYREVILGSIDRNDIMRILLENVPQFRYCYQRELDTRQKGIDGVLTMKFVIGPSGHVTRARIVKSDNSLPRNVKSCVVSHLKTIVFPKPKGGGEVSVNTPLNLHSKSL